jgi:hypothetical protein
LQLGERASEIVNVMERPARDDRIEAPRVGEFLERDGVKVRAVGRSRIDRDDSVADSVQCPGGPAIPASDLQHPQRSRWHLSSHKFEYVHLRATSSSSTPT